MEKAAKQPGAEQVIRRISDLRKLGLSLANAGLNAGLFEITIDEAGPPPAAEDLILYHANRKPPSLHSTEP